MRSRARKAIPGIVLAALVGAAAMMIPPRNAHAQGTSVGLRVTVDQGPSREEVEGTIAASGAANPAWWDSVELEGPERLDLTGQAASGDRLESYLRRVVYRRPALWKGAVKLLHRSVEVNKDDPEKRVRLSRELARAYALLLDDHARAAYWYRQVPDRTPQDQAGLAECYLRLGNREMAIEALSDVNADDTTPGDVVRLWAEAGDVDYALTLAKDAALAGMPDVAHLAAGDACRRAGRIERAVAHYAKVLEADAGSDAITRNKRLAAARARKLKLDHPLPFLPDGAYRGSHPGYVGPVVVEVVVKDHKILSVRVVQHREDRALTSITVVPARIVEEQRLDVDADTHATVTSDAIKKAAARALVSGLR